MATKQEERGKVSVGIRNPKKEEPGGNEKLGRNVLSLDLGAYVKRSPQLKKFSFPPCFMIYRHQ